MHNRIWETLRRIRKSKKTAIGIGVFLLVVVVIQLLLPQDRAFLNSYIDDTKVSLKTEKEITSLLDAKYRDGVVLTTEPSTSTPFSKAGVIVESDQTAKRVASYPLWQRFIPLSSIVKLLVGSHQTARISLDPEASTVWALAVNDACKRDPVDAGITLSDEGDTLVVSPSKTGRACDKTKLIKSLRTTPVAAKMIVHTRATTIAPKRSDASVAKRLKEIQSVIDQGITVKVLDTVTSAEPSEIVSWLAFKDGANGDIVLDIDASKVTPFIERAEKPIYIAPGTTVVRIVDGLEVSRMEGSKGRGIDKTKLLDQIRLQLQQAKTTPIQAVASDLPPKLSELKTYSNSVVGLNALLADIVKENHDMSIAIRELSGQGRVASASGNKTYEPASTYKLFIAYSMIKRVESGALKWDSPLNNTTLDECLTRMIVVSDNDCPRAFASQTSWGAIQSDLKALGMVYTNLNTSPMVGNTTDQALFLEKLYRGQLMKDENKNKLFDLMKRQKFRLGIPAGVPHTVADKVGFLSGLLHDSAIVYSPKGDYALSIYSDGGSWADIAKAARRINELLES